MTFEETIHQWLEDNEGFAREAMEGEVWGGYDFDVSSLEGIGRDHFRFSDGTEVKNVDSWGGEDEGRDYGAVWEFTKEGENPVFIKFYGWYASHYGSEYEGFKTVTPKVKEVTVYE